MVSRFLPALTALAALLCAPHSHAGDGHMRIGMGKALNNNTHYREETKSEGLYPGQLVDIAWVWERSLGGMDTQLAWTYVMEGDFGTEQAVTLTFLKRWQSLQLGAGLILGYTQSYETWQREYLSSDAYDAANPVGPRQCIFCGVTFQAAYEYKCAQLQLRYWRTDFNLYPGHNGALAVITFKL